MESVGKVYELDDGRKMMCIQSIPSSSYVTQERDKDYVEGILYRDVVHKVQAKYFLVNIKNYQVLWMDEDKFKEATEISSEVKLEDVQKKLYSISLREELNHLDERIKKVEEAKEKEFKEWEKRIRAYDLELSGLRAKRVRKIEELNHLA